jgi:glycosyltransferase involved in cell wall biosynthesis
MNNKPKPLVSIGLPVFNGQNFLEEAIESVLSQTYSNLELIISDNGSTDNTQKICYNYVKQDKRVQYYRLSKNYGAAKNYNRTFKFSNGKYFKWLAHDDLLTNTNISRSVKIMEKYPDITLCGCQKIIIDAEGNLLRQYNFQNLNLIENNPVTRYNYFLKAFSKGFDHADFVFGLIRTSHLKTTHLIGNYTSADFTLLAELILKGKFYVIEEPLFMRRLHQGISTSVNNNKSSKNQENKNTTKLTHKKTTEIAKWFDPKSKRRHIPHFKWLSVLIEAINEQKLDNIKKINMFIHSYIWFIIRFSVSVKRHLKIV